MLELITVETPKTWKVQEAEAELMVWKMQLKNESLLLQPPGSHVGLNWVYYHLIHLVFLKETLHL